MIELEYRLQFLTPAFLGNAEQTAQWRTPPIKALLRQWWRVAFAADQPGGVDVAAMRQAEGRLFGVAADTRGDSRKSRVRLRLSRWDEGALKNWSGQDQQRVVHPEVKNREGRVTPVGSQLYLGYGPLVFNQGTALKGRAAIQAAEYADLAIAFPDDQEAARLKKALWLMHHYGTLGGRSRNGWGSFSLQPLHGGPAFGTTLDESFTLPWRDALASDWAQAIGCDDRGRLIWQTESLGDWKATMRQLAEVKIGLRTQRALAFNLDTTVGDRSTKNGIDHATPQARHWLSYPVTNHSVREWGNNARLPNSLRFKVRPSADGKSLHGVIFHMPCQPPSSFRADRRALEQVWAKVHAYLDQPTSNLKRIAA